MKACSQGPHCAPVPITCSYDRQGFTCQDAFTEWFSARLNAILDRLVWDTLAVNWGPPR